MFLICFFPLYIWERKQFRNRNELFRQQLKEKYGVQDVNIASMIHIINELLKLQKQEQNTIEKRQKKRLIEDLDLLICKNSKGYVYFVMEFGNQTIKIGKADNPYQRILKGFGVKIPYRLELLYLLRSDNPLMTERLFHEYFKSKRVNGEWFNLKPEDVAWIRAADYPIHIYRSLQKSHEVNQDFVY